MYVLMRLLDTRDNEVLLISRHVLMDEQYQYLVGVHHTHTQVAQYVPWKVKMFKPSCNLGLM